MTPEERKAAVVKELRATAAQLRAGELTVDQQEAARIFDELAKLITFDFAYEEEVLL